MLDNEAALVIVRNPVSSQRAKHIDLACKLIRETVKFGQIVFEYVNTASMLADCLTQALPFVKHDACIKGLGMA